MLTIQAINANPQALSVTPPKSTKGGIKIACLNWNKKPISVKLAPDLDSVSTPFAPSVFGGGEADRKGILFNISDETYEQIYELSKAALELQESMCHTCLRSGEQRYPLQNNTLQL